MRWRAPAVGLVLLASLMVGVGDMPQGGAVADGRLRFRLPATWQKDPCTQVPDCVKVGPVGTPEDGRVFVMILPIDPHAVEGDPSLLLFDPVSDTDLQRYDLDGRPAVRVDEPGAHFLVVLLDAQGDRALVLCPLDGSLHDGCDTVIESLHVWWP